MNVIRQMRHSQFLRHNIIFFSGSVAVGALNYLYYPVLGRLLSPGSFGEVQTLVSLFLQLSVFLIVLSLVIVNIVANQTDQRMRDAYVYEFEKLALLISGALLVASILFGSALQAFLQFDSRWPFVLLALAIMVTVPFTLRGAYLRGQQKFGLVSIGNIVGAGGKLVMSAILVSIGLGTLGAVSGVVVAQIVACVYVAYWAWKLGLKRPEGKRFAWPNLKLLAPELTYGGIVLLASLAVTLQYSIDIIFIKHYFSAGTAGIYAGIAAVARILFFLTISIGQVLISSVKLKHTADQNKRLLYKSLLLLIGISAPVLVVLVGWPGLVVRTLMGGSYAALANLLPRLSLAIFAVAVLNLLVAYMLALRRYGVAAVSVLGLVISCGLIILHHGSPESIVNGLLTGSLAMLGLFGAWTLIERKRMT